MCCTTSVSTQINVHNCRPQRSWGKVIFSEVCVNNSVHRGGHAWLLGGGAWFYSGGACMVLFGGHVWFYLGGHVWFYLGGHAWFYSGGHAWFYLGGTCGFIWGACVVLFGGAYMVLFRGACVDLFGGHAWFYSGSVRGFIQGGVHGFFSFFGYNEIRSMSGRYASYWNAFLFRNAIAPVSHCHWTSEIPQCVQRRLVPVYNLHVNAHSVNSNKRTDYS